MVPSNMLNCSELLAAEVFSAKLSEPVRQVDEIARGASGKCALDIKSATEHRNWICRIEIFRYGRARIAAQILD